MPCPKYPNVEVEFTDLDADIVAIIGQVVHALTTSRVHQDEIGTFFREAVASDNVIQVCTNWVTLV